MAILNKKREMEYTMKLKENELVVYTATPEQISKMLKGGNNMGRPKGSKNKSTTLQTATEQIQKKDLKKKKRKSAGNQRHDHGRSRSSKKQSRD